jgi:hypothetical protein
MMNYSVLFIFIYLLRRKGIFTIPYTLKYVTYELTRYVLSTVCV